MRMFRICCCVTVLLAFLSIFPLPAMGYEYTELPGIKGYQPPDAEKWPWEQPYTGEQLTYLEYASRRATPYVFFYPQVFVDQKGHIRMEIQNISEKVQCEFVDRLTYDSGKAKSGDIVTKVRLYWVYPAAVKGKSVIFWDYLDTPDNRCDCDRWLYSPNLRRIRRLAGGDRADTVGGGDYTYDDIVGREVFEWNYKILGVDYVYPEETGFDTKVFETVGWHKGVDLTPYPKGPDGVSIKCTVVEATPKLPDYYLSKIITWECEPTEDFPCVDIRQEHYDPEGKLWKIRTRYWEYVDQYGPLMKVPTYVNGGAGKYARGWRRVWHTLEWVWDTQIDHRTYYHFFGWWMPFEKSDEYIKDEWQAPEFMTNEADVLPSELTKWEEKIPMYEKMRPLLPQRQPLWVEKFPESRKFNEDILKRPWCQGVLKREQEIRAKYAK